MPKTSSKVECPDCQLVIDRKNLAKHYRKIHPGLDPYKRLKETRERKEKLSYSRESPKPWLLGLAFAVMVALLIIIAALVTISLLDKSGEAREDRRDIFMAASDGVVINATFYQAPGSGSETIYLVHDIGQDRTVWEDFARELQSMGYNVMAPDMRGHGESTQSIYPDVDILDWREMGHKDFLRFENDIQVCYNWVHGEDPEGNPNTDANMNAAFIGVGRGGLYGLNKAARMVTGSQGILSASIISPTLDCYSLDVVQVFEDFGDIRPILMAASEGDGTGKLAIDTVMERKTSSDETNGVGVFVPGSKVGISLLESGDLKERIYQVIEDGWNPPI
ncbi:MAG: alpha/beta hydrolase [Thermoplasmatota archaeon]